MQWFRFYSEFIDDPKTAMMSDTDQLIWVKLLCLANIDDNRGDVSMTDEEIAWRLRTSLETWKHAKDKFRAKGMIEPCDGGVKISNWYKRQFDSDSSKKRTQEYRKRLKGKDSKDSKQKRDVTVTSQARHCDGLYTDTDNTQIQIQKEREDLEREFEESDLENSDPNPSHLSPSENSVAIAPEVSDLKIEDPEPQQESPELIPVNSESLKASTETRDEIKSSAAANSTTTRNSAANYESIAFGRRMHPELDAAGLADLWVGPGRRDFDEWLLKAQMAHLKKYNLSCGRGDAIGAISNMIKRAEWTKLEQRWDEAVELKQKAERMAKLTPAIAPEPAKAEPISLEQKRAGVARAKELILAAKRQREAQQHASA